MVSLPRLQRLVETESSLICQHGSFGHTMDGRCECEMQNVKTIGLGKSIVEINKCCTKVILCVIQICSALHPVASPKAEKAY